MRRKIIFHTSIGIASVQRVPNVYFLLTWTFGLEMHAHVTRPQHIHQSLWIMYLFKYRVKAMTCEYNNKLNGDETKKKIWISKNINFTWSKWNALVVKLCATRSNQTLEIYRKLFHAEFGHLADALSTTNSHNSLNTNICHLHLHWMLWSRFHRTYLLIQLNVRARNSIHRSLTKQLEERFIFCNIIICSEIDSDSNTATECWSSTMFCWLFVFSMLSDLIPAVCVCVCDI